MEDRILVVTSSILDQGSLPSDKFTSHGPLPVVRDLMDLGINLILVPNIQKQFELYEKHQEAKNQGTKPDYERYIRTYLTPLVSEVMDRVKKGSTFLGILSYAADETQRVEPITSPIMIELFRLFDRNCMLTPYFEIKENLSPQEMDLIISDIAVSLGI